MKQGGETSIHGNDKIQYVLFPEVYSKFVFELYKNHDDLVRGMTLAQVKISDGSAIDYLNTMLGTQVTKFMPMEVGYALLLDALNMRIQNKAAENKIDEVAKQFSDHSNFPHRSDPTKPIFPDEPTE